MQLDAIEAKRLRRRDRIAKCPDDLIDIGLVIGWPRISSRSAAPSGPGADSQIPDGPIIGQGGGVIATPCSPECQICGIIRPPAAWTSSIAAFQPASASAPWKCGSLTSIGALAWGMAVAPLMISPAPPSARRR